MEWFIFCSLFQAKEETLPSRLFLRDELYFYVAQQCDIEFPLNKQTQGSKFSFVYSLRFPSYLSTTSTIPATDTNYLAEDTNNYHELTYVPL